MVARAAIVAPGSGAKAEIRPRRLGEATPRGLLAIARSGTIIVARWRGRVVGVAGLRRNWIHSVYVEPSFWERGIGRALVDALLRLAGRRGTRELRLLASPDAARFYDRLGFRRVRLVADELGVAVEMARPTAHRR